MVVARVEWLGQAANAQLGQVDTSVSGEKLTNFEKIMLAGVIVSALGLVIEILRRK